VAELPKGAGALGATAPPAGSWWREGKDVERTMSGWGLRRLAGVVLSVAVLLPLVGAQTRAHAAVRPAGQLVPRSGLLLGAYVDPNGRWTGNEDAIAEVSAFEKMLGRKVKIDHHYYSWTNTFPSGLEQWDLANGRTPLISWDGTDLDSILSGSYDAMIRARAQGVKALGKPVFLRWCWEMNGEWSGCGGDRNNDPGKTNGPAKFVAAWRHIHNIFQNVGATNTTWVWSPNDRDVPSDSWNHWTRYYPGDAYVDWVGIDGYNWGNTQSWSSWSSFSSLFANVYRDYAGRKPIIIAETASAEQGGSKPSWITSAASQLKKQFPGIAALVWFDVNKEADWRPNSSQPSFKAFRQMAHDPYFGGQNRVTISRGTLHPNRVSSFGVYPRPVRRATGVRVRLGMESHLSVVVRRRPGGGIVRHLRDGYRMLGRGPHAVWWHRRNDRGQLVRPGRYRIVVTAWGPSGKQTLSKVVRAIRLR
jgi:hypothetical protein